MKQFAFVSALAALGTVSASPTATEKEPPSKRASLPTVTVSGNGKPALMGLSICNALTSRSLLGRQGSLLHPWH